MLIAESETFVWTLNLKPWSVLSKSQVELLHYSLLVKWSLPLPLLRYRYNGSNSMEKFALAETPTSPE